MYHHQWWNDIHFEILWKSAKGYKGVLYLTFYFTFDGCVYVAISCFYSLPFEEWQRTLKMNIKSFCGIPNNAFEWHLKKNPCSVDVERNYRLSNYWLLTQQSRSLWVTKYDWLDFTNRINSNLPYGYVY